MSELLDRLNSADYQRFLADGGSFEVIATSAETDINEDFRASNGAALKKGMEIPPPLAAVSIKGYREILTHGEPLTRAITHTYANEGKVTYFDLDDGTYRLVFEK